jgi:anti-anti-sigma factor
VGVGTGPDACTGLPSKRRGGKGDVASRLKGFRAEVIWPVSAGDEPPTAVIQVWGELDINTAPALDDALLTVSGPGVRVVIELSTVSFIDSSGISLLVRAVYRSRTGGGDMSFRNPSPMAWRTLEILGLQGALPIDESSS